MIGKFSHANSFAAQDAAAFTELVNLAKNALKNKPGATLAKGEEDSGVTA